MASNFQQEVHDGGYSDNGGGYDVKVIENYPEDFNCGICTLLIKDATHGCDNHVFCKSCLQENIDHGVRDEGKIICPGGCKEIIDPLNLQPSKLINRIINKLNSKCKNASCQWKGDLMDFVQDHQKFCEYSLVPCNNDGCEISFFKKDILIHEKDCLHQIVECDYCQSLVKKMNKVCAKDASVNHTELMSLKHQQVKSIEEISLLKHQQIKSIEEISLLKHQQAKSNEEISLLKLENDVLKAEVVELEKKSNEQIQTSNAKLQIQMFEISRLKDEVKNNMKKNQILQYNNQQLKDVRKKENSNLSDGTLKLQEEKLKADLNTKANEINGLKDRINAKSNLKKLIVSLINDDSVLKINILDSVNLLATRALSSCYEKNNFDYVIDKLGLRDEKVLMDDLFQAIPYHLYECYQEIGGYCQGWLCFPIDFSEMDFEISIPNRFKLKFSRKECLLNKCYTGYTGYYCNYFFYLLRGQSEISIKPGVTVNIQNSGYYDQMMKSIGVADWFGERYACLHYVSR